MPNDTDSGPKFGSRFQGLGFKHHVLERLWEFRIYTGLVLRYKEFSPSHLRRVAEDEYIKNPLDSIRTKAGFMMFLNPVDRGVSAVIGGYGYFEPKVTYLFEKLLSGARLVVDVGANIGWFSLYAARKGITTYSFEPEETNFRYLCRSIEANGFVNAHPFPYAIWDKDGEVSLGITDSDNKGTHSIVLSVGQRSVQVPSKKLDTLFPNETIDILKLDAEGAEPEVLMGAERILAERRVRSIIMEWSPQAWRGRESMLSRFHILGIDRKGKSHNLMLRLKE